MTWADSFERAATHEESLDAVREALADRRATRGNGAESAAEDAATTGGPQAEPEPEPEPSPERVVADADVLAADLLVGGDARAALDHVRAHSWVVLVASDPLLDDAQTVIAALADDALAADWRARVEAGREAVGHPRGDHPALASAMHGGAMHVLTLDEGLQSAGAGASVRAHVETSLKSPAAFARLFDPEKLYPAVADDDYPGPDCDPRG